MKVSLRRVYLYLFSAVGLILILIGATKFIDLGLRMFVFQNADYYPISPLGPTPPASPEKNLSGVNSTSLNQTEINQTARAEEYQRQNVLSQRERDAANALGLLIIGLPLYLYHWRLARKEEVKEN